MSAPNVAHFPGFIVDAEMYHQLENYPFEFIRNPLEPIENYTLKSYRLRRKAVTFGVHDFCHDWTPELLDAMDEVEKATGSTFDFATVTLYPDGRAFVDEELTPAPVAVLSFGATRTVKFKKTNFDSVNVRMEEGSLLWIRSDDWTRSMPADFKVKEGTITIDFRKKIVDYYIAND